MNKKPLIITLIVIATAVLVSYFYFFQPKVLTEEGKLDELHELSSQSKNDFTEQQKMDILDSLAGQQS